MQWPQLAIQRCTNHKLWNLLAKAPAHLREELAEDYRRMIYGPSREDVEQARVAFLRKWKLRCKAVSSSFEGAGDELLHLYQFSELAMESAAYYQRAGTDQRGISPADQNPGFTPQRRGRAVLAFRPLAQRSSAAATPGRLARSD